VNGPRLDPSREYPGGGLGRNSPRFSDAVAGDLDPAGHAAGGAGSLSFPASPFALCSNRLARRSNAAIVSAVVAVAAICRYSRARARSWPDVRSERRGLLSTMQDYNSNPLEGVNSQELGTGAMRTRDAAMAERHLRERRRPNPWECPIRSAPGIHPSGLLDRRGAA
jgi:hypothetical protein